MRKTFRMFFVMLLATVSLVPFHAKAWKAEGGTAMRKEYNSYKGLVMAGYQGWFNAPDDGAGRGWYHYRGRDGFRPGSASVDFWPETGEYEKLYKTEFRFADGSPAYTFSSYDYSTVDTHFRWMSEYGIDGVFMQRFVSEISGESGRRHFDKVLANAMTAANKYGRAICVMYDLSGMKSAGRDTVLNDIRRVADEFQLFNRDGNPSYLYHNGRPLVTLWGVGFNDGRRYTTADAGYLVDSLKRMGFSVMLGVPTYWRDFGSDTEADPRLHGLIRKCDVVMPWFVGRYDQRSYEGFKKRIGEDKAWADANGVDYAPLCFPGFSWANLKGSSRGSIDRDGGRFFWSQLSASIDAGAEMIYIAMFDEIDEGTAIFKCAKRVPEPAPGSTFVPIAPEDSSDNYLWLAGQAGRMLRGEVPLSMDMPVREQTSQRVDELTRNKLTRDELTSNK